MNTTATTRHTCSILPPYLLERLSQHPDPKVAQAATRTLRQERELRVRRDVRSARTRDGNEPGLVPPSLIPPDLRHHATTTLPSQARGRAAAPTGPKRTIYDAQQQTTLPGAEIRTEGSVAATDESVNEAYDGLGATWQLYEQAYQQDSLDGKGLALVASVHYDRDFDNAFWDGEQMVFGDGDGVYFNSFTDSPDVIGHELTHGVTQFSAGLTYVGQSGALNESVSDVFGSLVKQIALGQSAGQADWLIGAGLFTSQVHGVALRSMKEPGTAYDDPHLGKDPQPATMDGYVELPHDGQNDNGGVHTNSGIPNHAFYLAATAIGGNAWEGAGKIWYAVLTGGTLAKDADFTAFAAATIAVARDVFGVDSAQATAVSDAWTAVKVPTSSSSTHP